jgi:hypothetical protein
VRDGLEFDQLLYTVSCALGASKIRDQRVKLCPTSCFPVPGGATPEQDCISSGSDVLASWEAKFCRCTPDGKQDQITTGHVFISAVSTIVLAVPVIDLIVTKVQYVT